MKWTYLHTYQRSMWWLDPTLLVEAETRCRNSRNWSSRPKGFRNTCWQNLDKAAECQVWAQTQLNCSPNRTKSRTMQASAALSHFPHASAHPVAETTDSQSTRPHKGSSVPPGCAGGTCPQQHQLTGASALQQQPVQPMSPSEALNPKWLVQCNAKLALRWTSYATVVHSHIVVAQTASVSTHRCCPGDAVCSCRAGRVFSGLFEPADHPARTW